ncbi:hypothetical protein BGZ99_008348 [Dissophora globulifera]|uniref:ArnT-like N-terminal domain-containing protein n=1 Tax=Dissophora globulifera TaxID=979702 RepID=A0A9P6UPS7_9FUNG|nr:hypothetical protein BGZ99_008348 [Dissophora globulifera]
MSFGGYHPPSSPELPFTTVGTSPMVEVSTTSSRRGSFSSVHSNHSDQGHAASSIAHHSAHYHHQQDQQRQQQSPYHSPYSSRPSTPVGATASYRVGPDFNYYGTSNYSSDHGGYTANGYGAPSPTHQIHQQQQSQQQVSRRGNRTHDGHNNAMDEGGYSSGYDSTTGVSSSVPHSLNYTSKNDGFNIQSQVPQLQEQNSPYSQGALNQRQQQQRYFHRSHSRSHSNASETSLSVDTGVPSRYSPGPVSLSSAGSSRRGSVSESGGGGGNLGTGSGSFFSRKRGFRPTTAVMANSDGDDDLDEHLDNRSSHRSRARKANRRSSKGGSIFAADTGRMGRVDGILNDWDLLLPSRGSYQENEVDEDEEMTENERWKKRQLTKRGWESAKGQGILLAALATVAVFVRIWKLAVPSAVVFDEQHFGGFTRDYLDGNFFLDVHPPLGKMLFSLTAYLLGFDGKFDFTLGSLYPENVPYIGMRMVSASCGVILVPLTYLIMKNSGHSTQAAIVCALLVVFESLHLAGRADDALHGLYDVGLD